MSKLTEDVAYAATDRAAAYHKDRLEMVPATKGLFTEFGAVFVPYHTVYELWTKAEQRRTVLVGALDFADEDFDTWLSKTNGHVLAYVGKDRDSPAYRAFFSTGRIEETTEAPKTSSVGIAERITLAAKQYPDAVPATVITAVNTAAAEVQTAIDNLTKQDKLIEELRVQLDSTRVPVINTYNANYHKLSLMFPKRNRRVKSFFEKSKNIGKKKKAIVI